MECRKGVVVIAAPVHPSAAASASASASSVPVVLLASVAVAAGGLQMGTRWYMNHPEAERFDSSRPTRSTRPREQL